MGNEKNLIPNNRRSKDEVRKNARKGGIRSGQVRRAKRSFKEAAKWVLAMERMANVNGELQNISNVEAIVLNLMQIAMDNDSKKQMQAIHELFAMESGTASIQEEKLLADIENTKAKTKAMQGIYDVEIPDDGFLDAMADKAETDWSEENEDTDSAI